MNKPKLYFKVKQKSEDAKTRNKTFMEVEVELHKQRMSFGRKECLISPVSGMGEIWITEGNLIIKK